MHRIIKTQTARDFFEEAGLILKIKWPKNTILVPTAGHQMHIKATPYVKNWRRDVSNCTKILKDVMSEIVYDDDKFVHIDYNDAILDKENPRIEIEVPLVHPDLLEKPSDPIVKYRDWPEQEEIT